MFIFPPIVAQKITVFPAEALKWKTYRHKLSAKIWTETDVQSCPRPFLTIFETQWLELYTPFFYKNIFYKNIEAEICEILRIFLE